MFSPIAPPFAVLPNSSPLLWSPHYYFAFLFSFIIARLPVAYLLLPLVKPRQFLTGVTWSFISLPWIIFGYFRFLSLFTQPSASSTLCYFLLFFSASFWRYVLPLLPYDTFYYFCCPSLWPTLCFVYIALLSINSVYPYTDLTFGFVGLVVLSITFLTLLSETVLLP